MSSQDLAKLEATICSLAKSVELAKLGAAGGDPAVMAYAIDVISREIGDVMTAFYEPDETEPAP